MRISVNGDCATITSAINFDDLKKVGPVVIENEDGTPVYAAAVVDAPSGTIGTSVVNFDFKNAEGFACINVNCSTDAAIAKEELLNPAFANLSTHEGAVNVVIANKLAAREALAANITFN